jgi:hypothetical protein
VTRRLRDAGHLQPTHNHNFRGAQVKAVLTPEAVGGAPQAGVGALGSRGWRLRRRLICASEGGAWGATSGVGNVVGQGDNFELLGNPWPKSRN